MFMTEDTDKAVEEAGKWMKENPGFKPKFTRIANVVMNGDVATKRMTIEVMNRSGVDCNSLAFSWGMYALGVLSLSNHS